MLLLCLLSRNFRVLGFAKALHGLNKNSGYFLTKSIESSYYSPSKAPISSYGHGLPSSLMFVPKYNGKFKHDVAFSDNLNRFEVRLVDVTEFNKDQVATQMVGSLDGMEWPTALRICEECVKHGMSVIKLTSNFVSGVIFSFLSPFLKHVKSSTSQDEAKNVVIALRRSSEPLDVEIFDRHTQEVVECVDRKVYPH